MDSIDGMAIPLKHISFISGGGSRVVPFAIFSNAKPLIIVSLAYDQGLFKRPYLVAHFSRICWFLCIISLNFLHYSGEASEFTAPYCYMTMLHDYYCLIIAALHYCRLRVPVLKIRLIQQFLFPPERLPQPIFYRLFQLRLQYRLFLLL